MVLQEDNNACNFTEQSIIGIIFIKLRTRHNKPKILTNLDKYRARGGPWSTYVTYLDIIHWWLVPVHAMLYQTRKYGY